MWPLSRKLNTDSACRQKHLETPEYLNTISATTWLYEIPISSYTVKTIYKNHGATCNAYLSSIIPNAFRKSVIQAVGTFLLAM